MTTRVHRFACFCNIHPMGCPVKEDDILPMAKRRPRVRKILTIWIQLSYNTCAFSCGLQNFLISQKIVMKFEMKLYLLHERLQHFRFFKNLSISIYRKSTRNLQRTLSEYFSFGKSGKKPGNPWKCPTYQKSRYLVHRKKYTFNL